ncbi:hypothetical protein D9M71_356970 [compost metagenome]
MRRAATIDSVPGWLVPQAMLEMAVSIRSAPFSIALSWHMLATPAVSWECTTTSSGRASFRALTRSPVAYGVSRPAMSLMAMESTPMLAISRPWATNASMVCTGLVV